ncbi:thioesterase [Amycolatopsis sp. WAC 04182]|uniref:thioesterase II family protein n=1 Tax=Amycolatopsis sp. WAC 04182 TaxID=2203198 RepID=UPI000F77EEE9|nr:alpha/beta fold hydrolase [Amycolatopsis sp. WAC 04182]RSN63564.1 thioesterase [Amycolatopsis sp. WAC 04182]
MSGGESARTGDVWLHRWRPGSRAGARLVCFPHAGGSAAFFAPWSTKLPTEIDVAAVRYPGRADRLAEPPLTSMPVLVDAIAGALEPDGGKPTVLFGHSLGALVAYEVARELTRRGVPPAQLIVSGRRAPGDEPGGAKHLLSDDDLVGELVRLGGTDPALLASEDARSVFLPAIRADFRLAEKYRRLPGREPSCPLTVVMGDEDADVDVRRAGLWAECTTNETFAAHVLPGGHFYLIPQEKAVLALLVEACATPATA